ncbi:MAG: radical SAM protein [Bacillota bacterium]
MKILFIYPDYKINIDPFTKRVTGIEKGGWYMEGLASLAAVLKENGHQVSLYHLTAPVERKEFQAHLRQSSPDLIGFVAMTRGFPAVREYARWVKDALDVLTICGSYHPTTMPEEVIAAEGIDILCRGEGEEALCELVKRLDAGEDYTGVLNLWVKENNRVYRNPAGPLLEDIDQLPLPDFGLFDFSRLLATRIKTAVVILSRGCPYSCTYCLNSKFREIYPNKRHYARFHSPEYAIEYLQKLLLTCPEVAYLNFRDDILPWQNDWLANFARLYKRKINLPFICNYRANLFSLETARILREAGCYQIFFGVESGNDYIRNEVLNRNMSREQIIKAFAACRQVGIKTVAYNMIGLPYEDKARVLETIKLNAAIKADVSLSPIYYPYPDTPLFALAVREGFVPATYDYREDRCLEQPTLPLKQLLFARYYFKTFVRIYRLLSRLPDVLARPLERLADRLFTSPRLPHGLLVKIAENGEQGVRTVKDILRLRFPRIYLGIRNHFRAVETTKRFN